MSLLIVFVFTLIGGFMALWLRNTRGFLDVAIPFSGAVLLSISFVHIIPDAVAELGHDSGVFILLGFIIQLILEKYSHGIEHGHSHISPKFSTAVLWGLGLHALIEGVPLGYNFRDSLTHDNFTLAVVVHKIPEAFTLGVFLMRESVSRMRFALTILLFAMVTPFAAIAFSYLGTSYLFISRMLPYLVSVAIGSFLWISTTIFFESEDKLHDLRGKKLVAIILGFAFVIILDRIFSH